MQQFLRQEKKKTRKKSGAYLGMITEESGLVTPRRRQVEIGNQRLDAEAISGEISVPEPNLGQVKEYGLSSFITARCDELTENFKATLPASWNRILAMAYCRLRNQSPLKYVQEDFADSYLSQTLGTSGLSAHSLTDFLKSLGKDREGILGFYEEICRKWWKYSF